MMNIIGLFIFVLIYPSTYQFDLETCRLPLGVENRKLSDFAFSSSSSAGPNSSASKARIRSNADGWCPSSKISSKPTEFLQIDFTNLTVITLIELQGKFSLEPNDAFADAFRLEYRRDRRDKWILYRDFSGQDILSGNVNSHIPTIRDILPSIVVREIRIFPLVIGSKVKKVCLRLEVYGCSYQNGPISYSIRQGDRKNFNLDFVDEIFDGENENGTLKNGLGQLTDGILGQDDFSFEENLRGIGTASYDWVGWKKQKSNENQTVQLEFHFENFRQFSKIVVHNSNFFLRDVFLFDSISISHCNDVVRRVFRKIPEDLIDSRARFVNVTLKSDEKLIGKCLKIVLNFNQRSKWILISEIFFESSPISTFHSRLTTPENQLDFFPIQNVENSKNFFVHWPWLLISLILLLFVVVVLLFIYFQNFRRSRENRKFRTIIKEMKFDANYEPISTKNPFRSKMPCCYASNSDGSTISDERSSCSMSHNDIRRHLIVSTTSSLTSPTASRGAAGSEFGTIGTASPTTMSTVYQSQINPYLTAVSRESPNLTSNPYASIDMYTNPMSPLNSSEPSDCSSLNIQGPCGNSTFVSLCNGHLIDVKTIERVNDEQIIVEERFSTLKNRFGTIVHGYIFLRHPCDSLKPILIKALITDDLNEKKRFEDEHKILNRLEHPNLVKFYGLTLQKNYALLEHSHLGDLFSYLNKTNRFGNEKNSLSLNARLLIIGQLVDALRYLESENLVHRDIAARNCLIFPNYELKLSNFALASDEFHSHYLSIDENCRLPIRWMSPETLSNNEFSGQSDVWSFGITLWEVMTNCSALPYSSLTDEQVFNRLRLMSTNLVRSTGSLQLSKPESLSKELVDLMLECWRPFGERPTFREIFHFFNKRLDGIHVV